MAAIVILILTMRIKIFLLDVWDHFQTTWLFSYGHLGCPIQFQAIVINPCFHLIIHLNSIQQLFSKH